jgi:antitoxin PrlF
MHMHYHSPMLTPLDARSTLTERYQTTVPEPVRRALGLRKHDRVAYREDNGRVYLERAPDETADDPDPDLAAFLTFLARDMAANPAALSALTPELADRLADLTQGADVDLDAPLSPDDE